MNDRNRPRWCGLALALGLAVSGGLAQAQDRPFVVNSAVSPPTIDPAYVCDITDNGFISSLYVTLLKYADKPIVGAPDGITATREDSTQFVGYLAESWDVSEDGTVLTFRIRDGVRFPSGRPVDAHAVAASLNRNLSSGACGTYYIEAAQFGNTQSIEATDASTVVITLARSEPLVLHSLTQPNNSIVDLALVEEMGGDEWLAANAAGSGPYTLAAYEPGVRARFVANPDFFGDPPLEDEVIVNLIADDATLLLQGRNHQADVTLGLKKASVASLAGHAGLRTIEVDTARWQLIGLPHEVAPFDNPKLRQALSHAVPYEQILQSVAHGFGELFFGPFPPAFPAYRTELGAPRAYDMERARALLAESGVELPVRVGMIIREGENDQEQIATIVQSTWSQLGVNVDIQKLPASGYMQGIINETKTTALVRFDGPSVTDPAWLLDYDLRCASVFNTSDYCSEEAEALLDKAHPLHDEVERQAYWDRIAAIWLADTPRIPVYADTYAAVVSDAVTRWHFAQDGPFDLHRWGR